MFRLLRHATIAGVYHFAGTTLPMSVFDKVTDDGRLVYHYDKNEFQVIESDLFRIVYSSQKEMEEELAKNKDKK